MVYYCARHPVSFSNLAGIVSGPDMDPEITPQGIVDSEEFALRVKPFGIRRIISSNFRRASQMAEIVNDVLGVELIVLEEYQERYFGIRIGKPLPDLRVLYESNEGMETFEQLEKRFSRMPAIMDDDLLIGHSIATPLFIDYRSKKPMGKNFIRFGNCEYRVFEL
ncbi:histidine phosphatase family protein [Candidatus Woesearchaeota archaeon]|nr:histidine phosphatase family protein [Candidatus Woesearchaeota archaeon]